MAIRTQRVLVFLFLIIAVFLVFAMLRGSLRYKIMSNTEQLKAQLMEELRGSGESVVNVSIVRPWYSLSPKSWTYIVFFVQLRPRCLPAERQRFYPEPDPDRAMNE